MKILLLEDDAILAESMVQILEEENYELTHACDGQEVLDFSFENKYDLYLFDINVPLLNGMDTLKLLREAHDNTPTFFITARIDMQAMLEGFNCGCDDYIKKPFDVEELLVRIKAILKRKNPLLLYKNISFDLLENRVFKNKEELGLGLVEKEIFALLLKNKNLTVNKGDFFDCMNKPSDAALRVLISKIKKVLDLEITNIKGIGYKLETI